MEQRGRAMDLYVKYERCAAVEHHLGHGRRLKRTMRALGYPKSRELFTAWIDELAPGKRKPRRGSVPEELRREAVVAVASGRLKSREAAAELRVDPSVVRNWERQMLAGSKEPSVIQAPRRKRLTAGEEKPARDPSRRMPLQWLHVHFSGISAHVLYRQAHQLRYGHRGRSSRIMGRQSAISRNRSYAHRNAGSRCSTSLASRHRSSLRAPWRSDPVHRWHRNDVA